MVVLHDLSSPADLPSSDSLMKEAVMGTLKTLLKTTPDAARRHVEYTVINKNEEYEERWYPASTWLCTPVTSVFQDSANIEGFRHLHAYAQGHNDTGAQLAIQPPILTRVTSECCEGFERRFTVCTYLTGGDTAGFPAPTSSNVYLERLPEMTVFVRKFQGAVCEEKLTYETKRLAEALLHKEDVRTDVYITACYNSPFQVVSGKNEVWFLKFDRNYRKETSRVKQLLKYGSQSVEVPSVLSWVLYFVLAYFSFLINFCKTSLGVSVIVKDNWSTVSDRVKIAGQTVWHNVSFRAIFRSVMAVIFVLWNIAVSVVTGCSEYSADTNYSHRNTKGKSSSAR